MFKLFIFLMLPIFLFAEEEVEMRGFLYRDTEGRVILAKEPNLRSCCVHKVRDPVLVYGDLPEKLPTGAVTLKGKVNQDKSILNEAAIMQAEKSAVLAVIFIGAFLLLLGWGIFRVRGTK